MIRQATVFDSLAATYDADFTNSGIGKLQRERVWSFLTPLVTAGKRSLKILEINCGTGEDALRLATLGHRVIATDASGVMITKAKEKLGEANACLQISFEVCPFNQLKDRYADEQFDLILSNFGGLNCIGNAELAQLGRDLQALTKPTGHLFLVLMGNCCLWESGHYCIRGQFKKAFRRFSDSNHFTSNGQSMAIHYYSPSKLRKSFAASFEFHLAKPVGLFIPPSYLEERFKNKPGKLTQLDRLEKKFGYSFLASFADHYCAVFQKPGATT